MCVLLVCKRGCLVDDTSVSESYFWDKGVAEPISAKRSAKELSSMKPPARCLQAGLSVVVSPVDVDPR